jgi:(E)-4-hydroxy-3-methylbut-2-enyl-diphosphate synthase
MGRLPAAEPDMPRGYVAAALLGSAAGAAFVAPGVGVNQLQSNLAPSQDRAAAVKTVRMSGMPAGQASIPTVEGAIVGGTALALAMAGRRSNRTSRNRQAAPLMVKTIARPAVPSGGYCEAPNQCIRRKTRTVYIGTVPVGSDHPIATQTMTTTLTSDVEATVAQIKKCADMGIDIVRITVQGMTEAKACEHIKRRLVEDGYNTPIVADIHFTPKVALVCADFVDKVRVNPGNFADGRKSFDTISELTEKDVEEARQQIEEAFSPLVLKLKEQGKALRIGVNHGSLAERILFQYGDSPEGMVASAMEFGEVCRKHDYHNFVFSMKSSNPAVMVAAYRQLSREMYKRGWDYPLHLGVTEAGGGADGRIKSAVGIGALLLDGIGDTIRVSLTEDPEFEAKPCKSLRTVAERAIGKGVAAFDEHSGRRDGVFSRRKCTFQLDVPLNQDGTVLSLLDVKELKELDTPGLCQRLGLRLRADGDIQKDWKSIDVVVVKGMIPPGIGVKLKSLLDVPTGVVCQPGPNVPEGATILVTAKDAAAGEDMKERVGGYALSFTGDESQDVMQSALQKTRPRFILFRPSQQDALTFVARRFFADLSQIEEGKAVPTFLWFNYPKEDGQDEDDIVIRASADFGSLFLDGIGEGILWDAEDMTADQLRESSFNLLQASRMRISKTEFISCPSCGRTLFNLQETTAMIQKRTGHLPGVRIAVMGCIVNGPGEMADADFGYVGSGVGKIDLYVGYECVKRAIPSSGAVEALVDLIKEHGRWQEPNVEEVVSEVGAVAVL